MDRVFGVCFWGKFFVFGSGAVAGQYIYAGHHRWWQLLVAGLISLALFHAGSEILRAWHRRSEVHRV